MTGEMEIEMGEPTTMGQFRKSVLDILEINTDYQGSLEEYLRSLWALIQRDRLLEPTWDLILTILKEAFVSPPLLFDPDWLKFNQPLDWEYQEDEYVLMGIKGNNRTVIERGVEPIRLLEETILFQISDLFRMRDNQLNNEFRYLGVKSPTGNTWYNFDVFTYLKCATGGQEDHMGKNTVVQNHECDWVFFAVLLELGRLYE